MWLEGCGCKNPSEHLVLHSWTRDGVSREFRSDILLRLSWFEYRHQGPDMMNIPRTRSRSRSSRSSSHSGRKRLREFSESPVSIFRFLMCLQLRVTSSDLALVRLVVEHVEQGWGVWGRRQIYLLAGHKVIIAYAFFLCSAVILTLCSLNCWKQCSFPDHIFMYFLDIVKMTSGGCWYNNDFEFEFGWNFMEFRISVVIIRQIKLMLYEPMMTQKVYTSTVH